jgi:hypothetical protein
MCEALSSHTTMTSSRQQKGGFQYVEVDSIAAIVDAVLQQLVPHQPQRTRRGRERARLGMAASSCTRDPDAHRHRGLADIEAGNPVKHHFRRGHFPPVATAALAADTPGRASAGIQTHVLAATTKRTRNARAKHLNGLARTSVSRRGRTTPQLSPGTWCTTGPA